MKVARKLRILFVVPSLARAGAEKQAVDLANGLAACGHECHLASFEPNHDQLCRVDQNNVTYHRLTKHRKLDLSLIQALREIIIHHQIDVLHCTMDIAIFYGALAAKFARHRPAIIAGIHTTVSRTLKDEVLERSLYRWLLRTMNRVVFVCHRQMEYWLARDPLLKHSSTVIYNGVDCKYFDRRSISDTALPQKAQWGLQEHDRCICCIAAFRPEKAQENIIAALATLTPLHPHIHLLLAGDGEMRESLKRAVQELGVSARVHFLGILDDVRPVLAISEFSIISSVAVETFSFAMLESMAMQTPVVSCRIGGANEAIIPGTTGMLVAPGDINELTHAIKMMLDDPKKTATLGGNARQLVEDKFNIKSMVHQTEKLFIAVDTAHRTNSLELS